MVSNSTSAFAASSAANYSAASLFVSFLIGSGTKNIGMATAQQIAQIILTVFLHLNIKDRISYYNKKQALLTLQIRQSRLKYRSNLLQDKLPLQKWTRPHLFLWVR